MKLASVKCLETYINQYLKQWDFFGVIRVIKADNIIYETNSGFACLEFGIKNTMDTRFSLASMSKQFTAFAIMILHDMKLLDIDKPANLFLPPNIKISEDITVHHLLSHTSGLYNFYNFENDFFGDKNRLTYSQEEFYLRYINKQPVQEPGIVFDYNNSNYNLLAWIIENVSDISYENFLSKYIFSPLNMENSILDNGSNIITNRAFHYLKDFNNYIKCPYSNENFSIGAGAIVSNCDDLYKWYLCLRDKKIVSKETYTRFFTENSNQYCYGLEHSYIYGTERYAHGGDNLAVSTYMQNFFDEDLCIIILSNNESINQYRLGNAIADILHNVEVELPLRYEEFKLSKEEIEKYCGIYLKDRIKIELINDKLYFTRFKDSLHIELYPVGQDKFVRRYFDQQKPYIITYDGNGLPQFFCYSKGI